MPPITHATTLDPLPEGFYGVELYEGEVGAPPVRLASRTLIVRRYAQSLKIAGIEPRRPAEGDEVDLLITRPCWVDFQTPAVGGHQIWVQADINLSLPCNSPIRPYPLRIGPLPAGRYTISLLGDEAGVTDPDALTLVDSFDFIVEPLGRKSVEGTGFE